MTDLEDAIRTVDQWFLPCNGFHVWVHERGVGSSVIAVHGGFGIEHSELVAPLEPLTATRRVLWYDQRGSLRSPYSSSQQLESITFDAHVEDLIRLAEETGPADVIAHSMGTLVTMAALRRRPDVFRRIVLTGALPPRRHEPSPAAETWMQERTKRAAATISALGLDREDRSPREDQLAWRIMFATTNSTRDDAWKDLRWPGRDWYRLEVAEKSERGVPSGEDFADDLARHEHQVTVVIGDSDYVDFGGEAWRKATEEHPQIDLRILPDCGHSPWTDQPELFRRHLVELLGADAPAGFEPAAHSL